MLAWLSFLVAVTPGANPPSEPIRYETLRLHGFTVQLDRGVYAPANRAAWRDARQELEIQLMRINRMVPAASLQKIQNVPVWVHVEGPWTKCMAYHPSAEWLRNNGLHPAMAKGIEIGNIRTFSAWTKDQPWMVLHELAHAYHDRDLPDGFENAPIKLAFTQAGESGKYDSVLRYNGRQERHYALTNQMEYFAEATEAYFGVNDFFPFVRAELRGHDPGAVAMVESAWGVR